MTLDSLLRVFLIENKIATSAEIKAITSIYGWVEQVYLDILLVRTNCITVEEAVLNGYKASEELCQRYGIDNNEVCSDGNETCFKIPKTAEEISAFYDRIPDMSDEELLFYMANSDDASLHIPFRWHVDDEYDSRHVDVRDQAYNVYGGILKWSNPTLEEARERFDKLLNNNDEWRFSEQRALLTGKLDALMDYIVSKSK